MNYAAENWDAALCALTHGRPEPGRIQWVFSESLLAGDSTRYPRERQFMNGIIYIVGLVVIVVAILGFLGLR
jgi:hypothetical protein